VFHHEGTQVGETIFHQDRKATHALFAIKGDRAEGKGKRARTTKGVCVERHIIKRGNESQRHVRNFEAKRRWRKKKHDGE